MKFFFIFIVVLWSGEGFAQAGTVKLYGYTQPVIAGVRPTVQPHEEGNSNKPRRAGANYFIYLAFPKNGVVYPVQVWLKGKAYNINIQPSCFLFLYFQIN